jgi:hypothetical protein
MLQDGEIIQEGDEIEAGSGWAAVLFSIGTSVVPTSPRFRRAVEVCPRYRALTFGEVIRDGDEVEVFGKWRKVSCSIGIRLKGFCERFRRPVLDAPGIIRDIIFTDIRAALGEIHKDRAKSIEALGRAVLRLAQIAGDLEKN